MTNFKVLFLKQKVEEIKLSAINHVDLYHLLAQKIGKKNIYQKNLVIKMIPNFDKDFAQFFISISYQNPDKHQTIFCSFSFFSASLLIC